MNRQDDYKSNIINSKRKKKESNWNDSEHQKKRNKYKKWETYHRIMIKEASE